MISKKIFLLLPFIFIFFLAFSFSKAPQAHAYDPGDCISYSGGNKGDLCYTGKQGDDLSPGYACGDLSGYIYDQTFNTNNTLKCNIGAGYCCYPGTAKPPLPDHKGYDLGEGCGVDSVCYTDHSGDTKNVLPGETCGQLSDWHFGTNGSGNTPSCGINALCCDAGAGNVTPPPPNPCPNAPTPGVCESIDTAIGTIDVSGPGGFIKTAFGVLLSVAGGTALLLIIFSGYQIMVAQGDPEKVKEARERLTSAIIGLLFMIFSVTILQILDVDILHIPGFGK